MALWCAAVHTLIHSRLFGLIQASLFHSCVFQFVRGCCLFGPRQPFGYFLLFEDRIFSAECGTKVLAGRMGVDKLKDIGGLPLLLLRFITILCPINAYMRNISGDSGMLPQAALLSNHILNGGEFLFTNGEDLQSAFNNTSFTGCLDWILCC